MASNRKRQREIQQNTDRIGNNFDYFRFLAANKEALDGNADIGTTSITKKRKASSPPTVDTFKINSTASYLNSDVKQTPPGKRIRRALSRGLSLRRVSNKSAQPSGSTFNQPFSANRTPSKFGLNSLRDKSNIPFDQKYKSKDDSGLDLTLSKKDPWGTLRYNLRSKISGTIMRQKMKGQQDYSSLFTVNSDFLRFLATSSMKNQPKFEVSIEMFFDHLF
ncbi:unnamed protein product [Owenia fusiformis]|uniref:Uncharacterized protein n=1 Tax=Owenia fusiformis TaxID=6347 RepID=A0A8S4NNM7_OWEFU|nr:unnamed protein product [Owenia fusiformis]